MQLTIPVFSTLISLALTGPIPEAAPEPARAGSAAAQAETCAILGTAVNCRYHTNTGSSIQHVFYGGSAYFSCNSPGQCISGNW